MFSLHSVHICVYLRMNDTCDQLHFICYYYSKRLGYKYACPYPLNGIFKTWTVINNQNYLSFGLTITKALLLTLPEGKSLLRTASTHQSYTVSKHKFNMMYLSPQNTALHYAISYIVAICNNYKYALNDSVNAYVACGKLIRSFLSQLKVWRVIISDNSTPNCSYSSAAMA